MTDPQCTNCVEHERLRTDLQAATTQVMDTKELLSQRDAHITFVADERRTDLRKTELAKPEVTSCVYSVFEGAYQTRFRSLTFNTHTKGEREKDLLCRLIWLAYDCISESIEAIHNDFRPSHWQKPCLWGYTPCGELHIIMQVIAKNIFLAVRKLPWL